MTVYRANTSDGKHEFIEARSRNQAEIAAKQFFPKTPFSLREATNAEIKALLRSHSLPLDAGDE
jgi:hypothetical protein